MSEETEENSEVYNYYLQLSKPTEEDFKRVFTEDELKKLCIKHKCRVDIWRWNVAYEYRLLFTENGRYQRWSERSRLGMLAKAVNKMKPSTLYDEEEIKKTRREEWESQLKENILSLNYWERNRLRQPQVQAAESENNEEIQSECIVNSDTMNMAELLTESADQECQLEVEVHTSAHGAELLPQVQSQETSVVNTQTNLELSNRSQRNGEFTFIEYDTADSVDTVLYKEVPQTMTSEALHSEEIDPAIENIFNANTDSMTIDSQMSTQTEGSSMQWKDVIPEK